MSKPGNGNGMLSLGHLVGWRKSDPPYPTSMVGRCEAALDLPLEMQTPETIRLLIGQDIATNLLVPLALDFLEQDILTSGDLYKGDLLSACQKIPAKYWAEQPDHWVRLNAVLEDFDHTVESVNMHRGEFLARNPFGANV